MDPNVNEIRILWTDIQTEYLIDQRIARNQEFWGLPLRRQLCFWSSVAANINECFLTQFTARQVRMRWNNITSEYRVSTFILIIIKLLNYYYILLIF